MNTTRATRALLFGSMLLAVVQLVAGGGLAAEANGSPTAASHSVEESRFTVTARRLIFSASREVTVRARVTGTTVTVDIELDRPVRTGAGVEHLDLLVRVLDATDSQVRQVPLRLTGGMHGLSFGIDLPAGRYRFQLDESDIDAGPAKVRIRPGGTAAVVVDVFDWAVLAAVVTPGSRP